MAKPDPTLLDPARFPFGCEIQTRFGDLDTNRHLNNVAIAGILEDARVRFHAASGFHKAIAGMTTMVVNISIDYLGQGYYPKPLEVYVAAAELGRTSYSLRQLIMQEDRVVAFAQVTFVCVQGDRPAAVPATFVASVQPFLFRP